jgi:hypothetical protein
MRAANPGHLVGTNLVDTTTHGNHRPQPAIQAEHGAATPYLRFAIGLALVGGTLVSIVAIWFYFDTFQGGFSPKQDEWGQFGDYVGGVLNPLVSLMTLIVLGVLTWQIHQREQKRTQAELDASSQQWIMKLLERHYLLLETLERNFLSYSSHKSQTAWQHVLEGGNCPDSTVTASEQLLLIRSYDMIGFLLNRKKINQDMLLGFYTRPAAILWMASGDWISQQRSSRGQPSHLFQFEMLGRWAVTHRPQEETESTVFVNLAGDSGKVFLGRLEEWKVITESWAAGKYRNRRELLDDPYATALLAGETK